MTPKQLMATGDWVRSGDWPYYQGEGPRYQHRTLDLRIQGYATHRNTRRRGSKGITKIRVWLLQVNGKPVNRHERFAPVAERAAVIAINSATGCSNATVETARPRAAEEVTDAS